MGLTARQELIPLAVPEGRRLLVRLTRATDSEQAHAVAWSKWRRRHHATASRCDYARRTANLRPYE